MREQELYDKFFSDEEYELENAPTETYSYQSGWNNALKRASIIIRNEIRPQGEWITFPNRLIIQCSQCTALLTRQYIFKDSIGEMNYCPNCGADMRKERENDTV